MHDVTEHEDRPVKGLIRHGSGTKPDTPITRINHFISQEKGIPFS